MNNTTIKKIILLFTSLTLIACNTQNSDQRDVVTVTIEPLRYFVEQISGDEYNVNVIVPQGASPETYSPKPSDMREFERSKLFISIGLLENEHNISMRSKSTDIKRLELKDSIHLIEGTCNHHHDDDSNEHEHHHHHAISDPHIWSGVNEAKVISRLIKESLTEINPKNSDLYNQNYKKLILKIDSLNNHIKERFDTLENRSFIIFHPALTYFARQYNLTQISIEEEGKESSIKKLKDITNKGVGVKALFYQSQFSQSSVNAICRELNIDPISINPLSYDWLNNMYDISDKLYNALK